MLPSAKPIRELHGVTPSDLTGEVLASTEPLILRGLVARWPAVQAGRNGAAAQVVVCAASAAMPLWSP